jgi:hypothetical protein
MKYFIFRNIRPRRISCGLHRVILRSHISSGTYVALQRFYIYICNKLQKTCSCTFTKNSRNIRQAPDTFCEKICSNRYRNISNNYWDPENPTTQLAVDTDLRGSDPQFEMPCIKVCKMDLMNMVLWNCVDLYEEWHICPNVRQRVFYILAPYRLESLEVWLTWQDPEL